MNRAKELTLAAECPFSLLTTFVHKVVKIITFTNSDRYAILLV